MRTARTLHLIGGEWVCIYGRADVPAKNSLSADEQRRRAADLSSWPKESKACEFLDSDGRFKTYYRNEAELLPARMAAATRRVEEKAALAKTNEEKRKAEEAKAAEAQARANAELNAKHIAEKEAIKARLRAEREAAPAARIETPKTKTTTAKV